MNYKNVYLNTSTKGELHTCSHRLWDQK